MALSAADLQAIHKAQELANRRRAELVYMANGSRNHEIRKPPPVEYGLVSDALDLGEGRRRVTSFDPYVLTGRPDPEAEAAENSPRRKRDPWPTQQPKPKQEPEQKRKPAKKIPAGLPEYVTFYLDMGVHAARRRSYVGGGWRLYVMAKALDARGLGMIRRDDLQAYVKALGVNIRTFQRWMNEARNHGLLIDTMKGTAETPEMWLILPNPGAAAYGMGCEVGNRKAKIRADLLTGKGWKAIVWDAAQAARGQMMSREKLQKIYNVSARTQRYRTAQAGTTRKSNYCKSDLGADRLAIVKEYSKHKGVFVAGNKRLYWRLPDTRTTDQAQDAGKGRARKAVRTLRILQNQNALLQKEQGLSDVFEYVEYIRLFNRTPEQRKSSLKKFARSDSRIQEIYEISHAAPSGAGIWAHFPRV